MSNRKYFVKVKQVKWAGLRIDLANARLASRDQLTRSMFLTWLLWRKI